MKFLKLNLDKKYKNEFDKFDICNGKKQNHENSCLYIKDDCKLCEDYIEKGDDGNWNCGKCPFKKFESNNSQGCIIWFRRILNNEYLYFKFYDDKIIWVESETKKVREQFNKIQNQVSKSIEWV